MSTAQIIVIIALVNVPAYLITLLAFMALYQCGKAHEDKTIFLVEFVERLLNRIDTFKDGK